MRLRMLHPAAKDTANGPNFAVQGIKPPRRRGESPNVIATDVFEAVACLQF
jgi:hypothetical protein